MPHSHHAPTGSGRFFARKKCCWNNANQNVGGGLPPIAVDQQQMC
ncbi:hypothetical protein C4J98_3135 [Pseudomonas orientalis]|nr:hypothetical protein C4J98_3135 [Pseudomonas orientalis]